MGFYEKRRSVDFHVIHYRKLFQVFSLTKFALKAFLSTIFMKYYSPNKRTLDRHTSSLWCDLFRYNLVFTSYFLWTWNGLSIHICTKTFLKKSLTDCPFRNAIQMLNFIVESPFFKPYWKVLKFQRWEKYSISFGIWTNIWALTKLDNRKKAAILILLSL